MFCYLKYAEYQEIQSSEDVNGSSSCSRSSSISVRAAAGKANLQENKTLLFNPNCYIQILIDYVADQVKFDINCGEKIDFFCVESGELVKVHELKPHDYATQLMQFQKTYILVKYEKNENGFYKSLKPFLYKNSKEYLEVTPRLKKYLPLTRRSAERRSRRNSDDSSRNSSRIFRRSTEDSLKFGKSSKRSLTSGISAGSVKQSSSARV